MPASKNRKAASRQPEKGGLPQPTAAGPGVVGLTLKTIWGKPLCAKKPPEVRNVRSRGLLDLCKVMVPESASGCRFRGQGDAGGSGVELTNYPASPAGELSHPAAETLLFSRPQGAAVCV